MKPAELALSAPRSPCLQSYTPPDSPRVQASLKVVTLDRLEQTLDKLAQVLGKIEITNKLEDAKVEVKEDIEAEKPKVRASKLENKLVEEAQMEYKIVDERWNEKTSQYETVESVPAGEVDGLDKYVFVARARIDKKTSDPVFYIDIKSEKLRDILRIVLQDIPGVSLREDKPQIERNLLYHYLPELEAYRTKVSDDVRQDDVGLKHLSLLANFMKNKYVSTTDRLIPLLKNGEVTYELLWALFKPNTILYTIGLDTEKSTCFRFDMGEEKTTAAGITYFHMECRYLDFDGAVFGEASAALGIAKFAGVKRIVTLAAFPLAYHPRRSEMRTSLVERGRRFISLLGMHHLQYYGNALFMEHGEVVEVPVKSRIMVDAAFFRENNPNYVRPRISGLTEKISLNDGWFTFVPENEVKSNGREPNKMTEDDLLLCSPTVRGWSFGNKLWLEFAVDDISDIVWNPSSFANLAIPSQKKQLILALAEAHLGETSDHTFDDFVVGKGRGLIMLLHGPPGVGKTLTAEGLSEHLKRPLYAVSAGELGHEPKKLEDQLSHISQLAYHWKALVLMDEADVFVQARSIDSYQNACVSVFLRKLEYNQGIMFLTTNRVRDFDDAIQSRITLAVRYEPLSFATRKQIWASFLKKAATANGVVKYNAENLDGLARKFLNGRQIKNTVAAAHALAVYHNTNLSMSHLELVTGLSEEFESDFGGAGQASNKHSYL